MLELRLIPRPIGLDRVPPEVHWVTPQSGQGSSGRVGSTSATGWGETTMGCQTQSSKLRTSIFARTAWNPGWDNPGQPGNHVDTKC